MCSINHRRYTAAKLMYTNSLFTLSVAVEGMEELLRQIGGCSGRTTDKFETLHLGTCVPGDTTPCKYSWRHEEETTEVPARGLWFNEHTSHELSQLLLKTERRKRRANLDHSLVPPAILGTVGHIIANIV